MKIGDKVRIICPDIIMDKYWQKFGVIIDFIDDEMYRVKVDGFENDEIYKEGYFYEDELEEIDGKS